MAAIGFRRFNASALTAFKIAIDSLLKIPADFIDRSTFIRNKSAFKTLNLTKKTIIFRAEFYRTRITLIFKISHV